MRPAIAAEKAGIPSVAIAATNFIPLARCLGNAEAISQRIAEYPGAILNHTEVEIRKNIEKVTFPQIIEALTKPAKKKETTAKLEPRDIVFKGTIDEVNRFFSIKGWSDGLSITPPTIDKIEKFLKHTNLPANKEIAVLPAANLRATPWNIAANGVMAGCLPEHMPLLIAAVEAIGSQDYNLGNLGTTAALVPFLFIGGPIVKQLGIEYGVGATARGPNPAIGRALGLIVRNIAGFRPGEMYMGTYGYITPFVLAEDEGILQEIGWKPVRVRHGFDINASTVTAGATMNWGFQNFPSGWEAEGLLKCICDEIVKQSSPHMMLEFGRRMEMTVLINPSVARIIAHGGYSQEDAEAYLFEHSRIPRQALDFACEYCDGGNVGRTVRQMIAEEHHGLPKEWADMSPTDTVPAMGLSGLIHIMVCGDPDRNKVMALYSDYVAQQTKQVKTH